MCFLFIISNLKTWWFNYGSDYFQVKKSSTIIGHQSFLESMINLSAASPPKLSHSKRNSTSHLFCPQCWLPNYYNFKEVWRKKLFSPHHFAVIDRTLKIKYLPAIAK